MNSHESNFIVITGTSIRDSISIIGHIKDNISNKCIYEKVTNIILMDVSDIEKIGLLSDIH